MSNNNIPTAREKYTETKALIESRVDEYLKKYPPIIKERSIRIEVNTELYFAFYGRHVDQLNSITMKHIEREFASYIANKSDSEYSYTVTGAYCKNSFLNLTPNKTLSFGMFDVRTN